MKEKIAQVVDSMKEELIDLAKKIFKIAELSYEEKESSKLLVDFLKQNGFMVKKNIAGLKTAFLAETGGGRPRIALLAEYDALPEIGHACGHNMIGVMSCGAAVAVKKALGELPCSVVVVGCPAEERGAGKKRLVNVGIFDDVDVAMMIHPASMSTGFDIAYAIRRYVVEFFGKSAHAAADPASGRNALDALILMFNAIGLWRQQLPEKVRIHGIITNGGQSFNTIPEYTSAELAIRALRMEQVEELEERFREIVLSAARMTGCDGRISLAEEMPEVYVNVPLARKLEENYRLVGERVSPRTYEQGVGSTDTGAVSHVVPTIHAYINITGEKTIPTHTREFAKAANSQYGYRAMIRATKALAFTVYDLMTDERFLQEVKQYFQERRREF